MEGIGLKLSSSFYFADHESVCDRGLKMLSNRVESLAFATL